MYYGHPQNRFWPVMEALFHVSIPREPEAAKAFILHRGLALYDVVYEAELPDASDAKMKVLQSSDLAPLLTEAPIEHIYTTGRLATELFAHYQAPLIGMESSYLPSTSPANQAHWPLEKLIPAYAVMKEVL